MKRGLLILAVLSLSACAAVEPWEKATLAKPGMKPLGPTPEISKVDLAVYPYREQQKGGTGIGGAGCGCN